MKWSRLKKIKMTATSVAGFTKVRTIHEVAGDFYQLMVSVILFRSYSFLLNRFYQQFLKWQQFSRQQIRRG